MRGGGGGVAGVSAKEYSCALGAQINFGDLTLYIFNLLLSARCHFYRAGPKKLSISRAQPPPLPLALVKDAARIKSVTHGAV
jgi:hypothetical protein